MLSACYINNEVISIVYAYKPEVKALKELIKKNKLQRQVRWYRWPSAPKKSRGLLLNVGFAGGLNPNLSLGQVVLIDKIVALDKSGLDEFIIDNPEQQEAKEFAKANNLTTAGLLTVNDPVTDPLLRDELSDSTKADVVDMEGYNVLKVLLDSFPGNCPPIVSFKVVTDNADSDTWLNIKQKGELWSKILAQKVIDFIVARE